MKKPKLLGLAASLRNARWGAGNRDLINRLEGCADKSELLAFLAQESELHLENFLQAGRRDGRDFLEIYHNLRKMRGDAGLSNSEIALAAALWAALKTGVAVEHISLAEFFSPTGHIRRPEDLRDALLDADGILVSGPVYFGDRGSLAEQLINFIARDKELLDALKGRLYGGIAVGAKRNGGQETTLIYQMVDMLGLGLLAVGNDSETTAQYGGTGHAGDVGTMHKDIYGIDTSMGVGRRMAHILSALGTDNKICDVPNVLFLLLQDVDGIAADQVQRLIDRSGQKMNASVIDVANGRIKRCIACDICPTHIDLDEAYRCIIESNTDDLSAMHKQLLHHDMLVPVVATTRDRTRVVGNYQRFIERTRYLRRGDYVWSDLLAVPLCFSEPGFLDTYSIRMLTSFLRHHTVLSQPLIGVLHEGAVVNADEVAAGLLDVLPIAARLVAGKLSSVGQPAHKYQPVGYVLSYAKDKEDERLQIRTAMLRDREKGMAREAARRLASDQENVA